MTSVLIVDDEPAVRDVMARWVSALGMQPQTAASANEALATLNRAECDLAVIDVMMPGHDGLWLATRLRQLHPHTAVVLATGDTELLAQPVDEAPFADFLVKPFHRERFALAVDRGRQWRKHTLGDADWHERLTIEIANRADEICDEVRARANGGMPEDEALIASGGERFAATLAHSERVARYALSVAREMRVDQVIGGTLETAARFHDIGKIAMPDALLTKPSPLTAGEMAIMRRHVDIGAEILDRTQTMRVAAAAVLATHEWFGGVGYPRGLAGTAIPLASRIIAVADAYDAMTQTRAYRPRLDASDAIAELLRCNGSQFDPEVVAAFLCVLGRH